MRPKKTSDLELLTAVFQCLIRHGITSSTHFIAKEVGVSQATLFKRFGTKEDLIRRALLSPILGHEIFSIIRQQPTKDSPTEQIETLSLALLHFFEEMVPSMMMLRSSGCDVHGMWEGENTPPVMMRKLLTAWMEHLQELHQLRDIPAESVALALLGAIQHRAMRKHILHDTTMTKTDEEYLSTIVDIFWNGIAKGESK